MIFRRASFQSKGIRKIRFFQTVHTRIKYCPLRAGFTWQDLRCVGMPPPKSSSEHHSSLTNHKELVVSFPPAQKQQRTDRIFFSHMSLREDMLHLIVSAVSFRKVTSCEFAVSASEKVPAIPVSLSVPPEGKRFRDL